MDETTKTIMQNDLSAYKEGFELCKKEMIGYLKTKTSNNCMDMCYMPYFMGLAEQLYKRSIEITNLERFLSFVSDEEGVADPKGGQHEKIN